MARIPSCCGVVILCLGAAITGVRADTIRVPQDQISIGKAISVASDGDVILVSDGVYTGPWNTNLDLSHREVTIRSINGAETCIIDGQEYFKGFHSIGPGGDSVVEGITIRNCRGWGAGARIEATSPAFVDCVFEDNRARFSIPTLIEIGGAFSVDGGQPTFTRCTFRNNRSDLEGGAGTIHGGGAVFTNCVFEGNSAWVVGGVSVAGANVFLYGCLFRDNSTGFSNTAGAVDIHSGNAEIINCTFYGNQSPGGLGGAVHISHNGDAAVRNCIVWGNSTPPLASGGGPLMVFDSIVEGGWFANPGNLNEDPQYIDAPVNLRIQLTSPALDRGSTLHLPPDLTVDLDGQPRVLGSSVDLGAYERDGTVTPFEAAEGTIAGEGFGYATASAGDVDFDGTDDIVIAAPFFDNERGRIEVYSGRTGERLYERLGEAPGDQFGWCVASLGDITGDGRADLAIGAPRHDAGGDNAGAVMIVSVIPNFVALTITGEASGDHFGTALATNLDISNDGGRDLIVGAPFNDQLAHNAGKVYAYRGATLSLLGSVAGEHEHARFGLALDGIGRVTDDEYDDFIVGAPYNDERGDRTGKAYVIDGRNFKTVWKRYGKRPGDQYGRTVAGIGDADSDEYDDFAVAAPYYDTWYGTNVGRVYTYSGDRGSGMYSMFGTEVNDWFGYTMARAGDITGDGSNDMLIASPVRPANRRTGTVALVSGVDGSVITTYTGSEDAAQFGFSIAVLGDLNGDGVTDVLIAAPMHDANGADSGYVEVIEIDLP